MPRRRQFSGGSLCALLRDHGFVSVRQKGSHRIMQKVAGSATPPTNAANQKAILTPKRQSIWFSGKPLTPENT